MSPLRILVLEDDEDLRERLAEVLREENYDVDTASSGLQALDCARNCAYDLIITDIRMAGMDGLQALEQVQQEQPEIYSLVITGYSTEADSIRAIRLGVGEYLKKPFKLDDFLNAVERLAARRKQILQKQAHEKSLSQAIRLALETLARTVAFALPDCPEGLVGVAHLAERLANHLGLSADTAEAVQLGTLVAGLQIWAPRTRPESLIAALSPDIRRLVAQVVEPPGESEESEESLPVQVIRASLTRLRPGKIPAIVESALADVLAGSSDARVQVAGGGSRSLLSLARALAYAGDFEAATNGFQQVLSLEPRPEEEAAAWLGLASLAQARADGQKVRESALKACSLGEHLAPLAEAQTLLQAGMLLAEQSQAEGLEFLERASKIFSSVNCAEGCAQSELVLGRCRGDVWGSQSASGFEGNLTLLLNPEYRQDLATCAWYLLPWLLESSVGQARPVITKALRVLARDFPRELQRCLQQGVLSAGARAVAAEALSHNPSSTVALTCLNNLSADPALEVRQAAVMKEETSPPLLRLYSFGPFEAFLGGERVSEKAWRGLNSRFLLARLASARGTSVSIDVLLDLFWPDDPEKARRHLSWNVSSLRRTLKPEGWSGELDYIIKTEVYLQLSSQYPIWHDYLEFYRHLEAARSSPDPTALEHLRQALSLYRGPYLEGCYMDWAMLIRDELERQVLDILRRLLQASKTAGQHFEVLEYGHRLLQLDECCQEAYLSAMQANLALGRPEAAVRLFESCTRRLNRELGMDPSIELLRERERALMSLSG